MWKLTITQKSKASYESEGKVNTYDKEQEISYESEEIYDLLVRVGQLSKLDATGKTTYTLTEHEKPFMKGCEK